MPFDPIPSRWEKGPGPFSNRKALNAKLALVLFSICVADSIGVPMVFMLRDGRRTEAAARPADGVHQDGAVSRDELWQLHRNFPACPKRLKY